MKLCFDQIGEKAHHISLDGRRLFFEDLRMNVELGGDLALYRKKGDDVVVVTGRLKGAFIGQCDLCAVDVPYSFEEDLVYRLSVGTERVPDAAEMECREEEVEELYLQVPEIDLETIIREQVYLNLPSRLVCRSACKGVCSGCGADLNIEKCRCAEVSSTSPFAILGKLKK